jgi:PAS domain S-box-containing protein
MSLPLHLLSSTFYLAAVGAAVAVGALTIRRLLNDGAPGEEDLDLADLERSASPDAPLAKSTGVWRGADILEYTHDAIIVWEMEGRGVLYWNRAAEQIYGYSRREAAGRTTHHLLRTQAVGGPQQLETSLARYGVWAGELRHTTRTGRKVLVQSRLALMAQRNGRWLVLEVNREVDSVERTAEVRRAIEAHLERLR